MRKEFIEMQVLSLEWKKSEGVMGAEGSLQKVQGHRAGVNADLTPPTGGPVGHACR